MSRNSLFIITAEDCGACVNYKKIHHEKVKQAFGAKGYPVTMVEVKSRGDDLKKYNIPESCRKCVRWFPYFAIMRNNELVGVFNGEKKGECYNIMDVGSKHPSAENLIEFYEKSNNLTLTNVPVSAPAPTSTIPSTIGLPPFVPTTCSNRFSSRPY